MATWDFGGGCPCGVSKVCDCKSSEPPVIKKDDIIPNKAQVWSWDRYFMAIADITSRKSKDPSSQVGAVLVDDDNAVVSTGFNGFPKGTSDDPALYHNREEKYKRVLHAECNALLFADRKGSTMYITHHPCSQCMAMMIQRGVKKIVFNNTNAEFMQRNVDSIASSKQLAKEANVMLIEYKYQNMENQVYE